ncbi:broad specificity phosphatase PhoE [Melghirimyces profundicolus]|uniref:Broad specificity phosphatase PhoE n=1 Tax=Melghirimyces profundicolus TaxID=1242148 RepID=A0A2T6C7J1_9BACL|nr:histidine phosphatase family protein [Melghirimyces profundicolus]PTX64253.1 broad specificity phosphatase PhoE [Melghirimyces profundicolus]
MARFYLVRHGEPDWEMTEKRYMVGVQRDLVPLSARGLLQAEKSARDPRLAEGEWILSSPYTRAMHTAAIISRIRDLPLHVEYDLHEWLPDRTLSYDSYEKLKKLREDFRRHKGRYPEGKERPWETISSVRKRARAVLSRYRHHACGIVVCHETVIQAITGSEDPVDPAGIVEWEFH